MTKDAATDTLYVITAHFKRPGNTRYLAVDWTLSSFVEDKTKRLPVEEARAVASALNQSRSLQKAVAYSMQRLKDAKMLKPDDGIADHIQPLAVRVDPIDCGCTDCVTGWSVPLNKATRFQLVKLCKGLMVNSSGHEPVVKIAGIEVLDLARFCQSDDSD